MVDSVSSAASTFDMLNQFSQESIIAPFECITVDDHSAYHSLKKTHLIKSSKRYEPSKSFSIATASQHKPMRHWKRTFTNNDYSSSPFNHHGQQMTRQQHTPRSTDIRNTSMSMSNVPTPSIYSPMNNNPSIRSTDLQSSPFPIRSVGSVQAINSPTAAPPPTTAVAYTHSASISQPEVDSLLFNVLMNDSILNFFRDMNFDSCVLCACTPNELSIRGTDSTIYLEKPRDIVKPSVVTSSAPNAQNPATHSPYHTHMYPHQPSPYHHHPPPSHASMYNQQQSSMSSSSSANNHQHNQHNSCSCGFSAVVNLRLSYLSGLFYEDELEITGIKAELKYRTSTDHLPVNLLELIERKESLPSPFDCFAQRNTQVSLSNKKTDQDLAQIFKQPVYQCKSTETIR